MSFIFGDHKAGKHSPLLGKSNGSGTVKEKQMAFEEIVLGRRIGKGSYGEVFLGTWRGTEVGMPLPTHFLYCTTGITPIIE